LAGLGVAARLAVAIEAAVLGAGATGLFDLTAQRLPGAMYPDGCVFGGNAGLLRELVQVALLQIHNPQRIAIFGLERIEQAGNALADFLVQLGLGLLAGGEIPFPGFCGSREGGALAVMIDDGVAQDAIEPSHNLFVLNAGAVFQSAGKGRLQNVFGGGPGFYALLEKTQELAMSGYELRNRFRREGLRGLLAPR
jgi:hypothetical protein